jgi:hypothetical protein
MPVQLVPHLVERAFTHSFAARVGFRAVFIYEGRSFWPCRDHSLALAAWQVRYYIMAFAIPCPSHFSSARWEAERFVRAAAFTALGFLVRGGYAGALTQFKLRSSWRI